MGNLRITADLHRLLQEAALHNGLDVSDVIRTTARGIQNGRPVVHFPVEKKYYERPGRVIRVRNFSVPDWLGPVEFRRLLAMRCMEELQKVSAKRPKFREVEGVDYIVEAEA